MLSQDRIKREFVMEHQLRDFTLQKQFILQEMQTSFTTSGLPKIRIDRLFLV